LSRLIVLLLFGSLTTAAVLAIQSCQDRPAPETQASSGDIGIVALPDGSTLLAEEGTIGRELVDWLESGEKSRSFELGGQEFAGRSSEPTNEAAGRLPRLIALLKAYGNVGIRIIGHSDKSEDEAADQALSEERARAVAETIEAGGISRDRISVEGRGGNEPVADNASPEGRAHNQRVSIVLTRTA
jgi:outer membrane protein OmpA-like peptidoglycan-associated protein